MAKHQRKAMVPAGIQEIQGSSQSKRAKKDKSAEGKGKRSGESETRICLAFKGP